jgi:hypothetical protein
LWSGWASSTSVEPVGDLLRVEPQEMPPLDVGDAAFGDKATDVAFADGEMLGYPGDVEKPGKTTPAGAVGV